MEYNPVYKLKRTIDLVWLFKQNTVWRRSSRLRALHLSCLELVIDLKHWAAAERAQALTLCSMKLHAINSVIEIAASTLTLPNYFLSWWILGSLYSTRNTLFTALWMLQQIWSTCRESDLFHAALVSNKGKEYLLLRIIFSLIFFFFLQPRPNISNSNKAHNHKLVDKTPVWYSVLWDLSYFIYLNVLNIQITDGMKNYRSTHHKYPAACWVI